MYYFSQGGIMSVSSKGVQCSSLLLYQPMGYNPHTVCIIQGGIILKLAYSILSVSVPWSKGLFLLSVAAYTVCICTMIQGGIILKPGYTFTSLYCLYQHILAKNHCIVSFTNEPDKWQHTNSQLFFIPMYSFRLFSPFVLFCRIGLRPHLEENRWLKMFPSRIPGVWIKRAVILYYLATRETTLFPDYIRMKTHGFVVWCYTLRT